MSASPVDAVTYEFEDLVCGIDTVDLMCPRHSRVSAVASKLAVKLSGHVAGAARINPRFAATPVHGKYELFAFMTVGGADALMALNAVPGWRRSCERAVCVIREVWRDNLPRVRNLLPVLDQFDHVFVEYYESVDTISRLTRTPVSFIAPSVDTDIACPAPPAAARSIDVYNIGRRNDVEHLPLLEAMERGEIFYYYTTVQPDRVWNGYEHRLLLANVLKRSRYSIAHPAKFTSLGQGQQELGFRYFEGAAAGTVLLGEAPRTQAFAQLFPWDNAVVELDGAPVYDRIRELDAQPELVAAIRRDNVRHSLLSHDGVYRWQQMLQSVGLDLLPSGGQRKKALADRAALVDDYVS